MIVPTAPAARAWPTWALSKNGFHFARTHTARAVVGQVANLPAPPQSIVLNPSPWHGPGPPLLVTRDAT